MKAFSDFAAVILFFIVYAATQDMVAATVAAVAIGILQAAYTYYKQRRLEPMQWLSLILVVGFGGLTIFLGDARFIMLKTTALTWTMAVLMLAMQLRGKNGLRLLLQKELFLPDEIWQRLGYAWIAFFAFSGALNLFVAYPFTPERQAAWASFKVFGYLPISIAFSVAQAIYIFKHLPKEKE